jgi:hypothetical protein
MNKKISLLILICISNQLQAQPLKKQEFGINAAGLFVKNQATIAPSFFYKYRIKENYQMRLQLAFDSRVTNDDRDGFFTQKQSNFTTQRDTNFNYEPTKNNAMGVLLGYQLNSPLSQSRFNYFYGIDLIYMVKETKKKGQGTALLTQGTTNQNTNIKSEINTNLVTYGLGIPLGITYYWDSKFYASIEAKFVIAYQSSVTKVYNESVFSQQTTSSTLISGSKTTSYGFDIGIKPLTGLCFGIQF